jgi:hypothetical protein
LDAKEIWSVGCQSLVAILMAKGRSRSLFTVGMISRPFATANEPFCAMLVAGEDEAEEWRGSLVGRNPLGDLRLSVRV